MTCRKCAVPNCQVLLITDKLFCTRHYARIPAVIIKAMAEAVRAGVEATDDLSRQRAKIEYEAAWAMALREAGRTTARNLGRTAAGPNDGPRVGV